MTWSGRLFCRNVFKPMLASRNSSTQVRRSPVYELRIYNIYPKDIKSFIELSTKWMHLRTAKSPLLGFWLSELGGINDAVHIWEYESLSDRARVRKELGGDESWQKNYIAAASPMWARQENSLLTLKQGTHLHLGNVTPGGVFELQTVPDCSRVGSLSLGTTLLAAFQTMFGQVNKEFRLLHHTSIDDAVQASHLSLEGVSGEVHTRLMLPAPWSTLQ
ncbi:protein NipSnap homolog 3A-like isoform X1 [Haliotis rufescens]|uniref:protein NipSnap homolog 3A-like isoform X1 n=1 Tax=Haliotis rufescens TaxID=6454 RepID=UPI00201E8DEE|nr:protein NipSnap homolog 3A-like isoform X1 [Haliotis rufescens]